MRISYAYDEHTRSRLITEVKRRAAAGRRDSTWMGRIIGSNWHRVQNWHERVLKWHKEYRIGRGIQNWHKEY